MNFGNYKGVKEKRIKETELLRTSVRGHPGKPTEDTTTSWMTCSQTIKWVTSTSNKKKHKADVAHVSTFLVYGKSTYFAAPAFTVISINLQNTLFHF